MNNQQYLQNLYIGCTRSWQSAVRFCFYKVKKRFFMLAVIIIKTCNHVQCKIHVHTQIQVQWKLNLHIKQNEVAFMYSSWVCTQSSSKESFTPHCNIWLLLYSLFGTTNLLQCSSCMLDWISSHKPFLILVYNMLSQRNKISPSKPLSPIW